MKTIIGIGNPGKKYELTRHNAGVMFVEHQISNSKKQDTNKYFVSDHFMNNSGDFVKNFKTDIENLYIAHDDLDLRLGEYKITKKAPKVHNGINDINEKLGTEDYWKIRIGVDNRDPENRELGEKYVLENFSSEELEVLQNVFEKIAKELS